MTNQIEKDEMPLSSYNFIYHEARLSAQGKKAIVDYLHALLDIL